MTPASKNSISRNTYQKTSPCVAHHHKIMYVRLEGLSLLSLRCVWTDVLYQTWYISKDRTLIEDTTGTWILKPPRTLYPERLLEYGINLSSLSVSLDFWGCLSYGVTYCKLLGSFTSHNKTTAFESLFVSGHVFHIASCWILISYVPLKDFLPRSYYHYLEVQDCCGATAYPPRAHLLIIPHIKPHCIAKLCEELVTNLSDASSF